MYQLANSFKPVLQKSAIVIKCSGVKNLINTKAEKWPEETLQLQLLDVLQQT